MGAPKLLTRHGEGKRRQPYDLSVPNEVCLSLARDRERDFVLIELRVEDLVVEERGSVRFEEDAGPVLFDHFIVLGGHHSLRSPT